MNGFVSRVLIGITCLCHLPRQGQVQAPHANTPPAVGWLLSLPKARVVRKKKLKEEDPRPKFFDVDADHEFLDVLAMVRAGVARKEWRQVSIHRARRPGVTWSFEIEYLKPYTPQIDLI